MALKDLSIKIMKIFNQNDLFENQQVTNEASDSIRILNAKLDIDSSLPKIFNQNDLNENKNVTNRLVDELKILEAHFENISGTIVDAASKAYPIFNQDDLYENMDVTNRLIDAIKILADAIEAWLNSLGQSDEAWLNSLGQSDIVKSEESTQTVDDETAFSYFSDSFEHWDIVGRCICTDEECEGDCSSGEIVIMATGTYSTECEGSAHLVKLAGPFDSFEAAYADLSANYDEYEQTSSEECTICAGLHIIGSLTKNCSGDCDFNYCVEGATSSSYIDHSFWIPGTHLDNCGNAIGIQIFIIHQPGNYILIESGNYGTDGSSEICCLGRLSAEAHSSYGSGWSGNSLTYPSGTADGIYNKGVLKRGNRETGIQGDGSCNWNASVSCPVKYIFSE